MMNDLYKIYKRGMKYKIGLLQILIYSFFPELKRKSKEKLVRQLLYH
jgi:hypothetical protein